MNDHLVSRTFLEHEARALLARLSRVQAMSTQMPMVPAAAISSGALASIERFLADGRAELDRMVHDYLQWLARGKRYPSSPEEAQRRFTILRLRFNSILSQFDIFADVLNQRSEHDTGVWLAGLDAVSRDALELRAFYRAPFVICYVSRGHGAAIRRARTRLPGGVKNPVGIIMIPRERMIGTGIASSLIHEVGHQGSALLDLAGSLRSILKGLQKTSEEQAQVWGRWERWISEILADFWAVAKIGIAATLGLIGVVSLPRAFVFRLSLDDPHPSAWIRVKLSCAMGNALYPDPQWGKVSALWETLYPPRDLPESKRKMLTLLLGSMPGFVTLLVNHRPRSLRGNSLGEVLALEDRRPPALRAYYRTWEMSPRAMFCAPPSLVFAAIGQARSDGTLSPEKESRMLSALLRHWAMRSTLAGPEQRIYTESIQRKFYASNG